MNIDRVSGQVLSGPLEPIYVYEAPVRLWHWVMMVAMLFLAATGYLIGSPPPSIGGEATFSYFVAWIRMIHFIAGMIFAVAFVVRIYWAFVGNHSSRAIFVSLIFTQCASAPRGASTGATPFASFGHVDGSHFSTLAVARSPALMLAISWS